MNPRLRTCLLCRQSCRLAVFMQLTGCFNSSKSSSWNVRTDGAALVRCNEFCSQLTHICVIYLLQTLFTGTSHLIWKRTTKYFDLGQFRFQCDRGGVHKRYEYDLENSSDKPNKTHMFCILFSFCIQNLIPRMDCTSCVLCNVVQVGYSQCQTKQAQDLSFGWHATKLWTNHNHREI